MIANRLLFFIFSSLALTLSPLTIPLSFPFSIAAAGAATSYSYAEYIDASHQMIKQKRYTEGERYAYGALTMLEEKVKKKQRVAPTSKEQYLLNQLPTLFSSCLRHKVRQITRAHKKAGSELIQQDSGEEKVATKMDDPQIRALYNQTDALQRRIYNTYRALFGDSAITGSASREVTEVENALKGGA